MSKLHLIAAAGIAASMREYGGRRHESQLPISDEEIAARRQKHFELESERRERQRKAREAAEAERLAREQHHIDRAAAKRARRAERNRRIALANELRARDKRSWPDDSILEKGNYECRCAKCGETFVGHKRRAICRECAR